MLLYYCIILHQATCQAEANCTETGTGIYAGVAGRLEITNATDTSNGNI